MRPLWAYLLVTSLVLMLAAPAFAGDAWVAWVWILHPENRHAHWTLWNAYPDQAACQQTLRAKRDDLKEDGYTITRDAIGRDSLFGVRAPDRSVAAYRCLPAGVHP